MLAHTRDCALRPNAHERVHVCVLLWRHVPHLSCEGAETHPLAHGKSVPDELLHLRSPPRTRTHTQPEHLGMEIRTSMDEPACLEAHTRAWKDEYTDARTHIRACTHARPCTHVSSHVHTKILCVSHTMQACIHTHAHSHKHAHAHALIHARLHTHSCAPVHTHTHPGPAQHMHTYKIPPPFSTHRRTRTPTRTRHNSLTAAACPVSSCGSFCLHDLSAKKATASAIWNNSIRPNRIE